MILSIKRAANERRQRSRKIIDKSTEKYRNKNRSLRNTSTDSKRATFVTLINHASTPIRKKKLSPTRKARKEANRNEFMEKGGVPDRVESLRDIDEESRQELSETLVWVWYTHPKWTEKGTGFDQKQIIQGRKRPGGERIE